MRRSSKMFLSASIILLISTLISVIYIRIFDADKKYLSNDHKQFQYQYSEVIPITGAVGPESFAFDPQGEGPYTGVSDGRIIKWQEKQRRWIDFAVTSPAAARDGCEGSHDHDLTEHMCGRPLGLRFNERTGDLYIADAYMGLVVVGPDGGLATRVATQAQGIPFGFTNALDIDPITGVVYFTDSSSLYQRRNHISVILSGDETGRLMKYDPESKEVTVVLENLSFPNGVALSQNGDFILVADTTNCRIFKFWLQTSKLQVLAELPGFPDNIKRIHGKGDEFWVGIHSRRGKLVRRVLVSFPWLGSALVRLLPFSITKLHSFVVANFLRGAGFGLGVKLNSQGDVLEMLEDYKWKFISEVEERNGSLWIGSVKMPFAAIQKL